MGKRRGRDPPSATGPGKRVPPFHTLDSTEETVSEGTMHILALGRVPSSKNQRLFSDQVASSAISPGTVSVCRRLQLGKPTFLNDQLPDLGLFGAAVFKAVAWLGKEEEEEEKESLVRLLPFTRQQQTFREPAVPAPSSSLTTVLSPDDGLDQLYNTAAPSIYSVANDITPWVQKVTKGRRE
ncbi:hypothetical protein DPEC_G00339980 [Dallia pectoralis]|uniref:Uncharacterized protein n=1 Tax=Dallia pectoralis TaxID=75939 RepID=A0ACC2F562_DALPE|nr:hypothetical protein DPEC_G00339980 [Dallia pectoralis]